MCTSSQPISGVENLKKVSDDLFRVLIEFKDYAIVLVDAGGYVIGWNLGATHMYG
jgi:hypothetical protein